MHASLRIGSGLLVYLFAAPAWAQDPEQDCGDTRIDISGIDVLYQALGNNGENTIGPRRLVVDQTGTIELLAARTFVQATPMDGDAATLALRKTGGRNRTAVTICTTDASGIRRIARQFEIPGGDDNVGQTWSFDLTGLQNRRLSVRLVGKNAVHTLDYSLTLTRPGAGTPWVPNRSLGYAASRPVVGFADLHNHQSTPEGFGGGVVAGNIGDTARFSTCSYDHARTKTGLAGLVVKAHPQAGAVAVSTTSYETGHGLSCNTAVGGIARCWADPVHHKMGVDALKMAHDNGLQLMVTHALSNQALCFLAASINPNDHHCSDMESAKLQILALKQFDAAHDWYEIVRDPWQARRAIAAGHLAVVLGVEVSNIFPDSDGDQLRQLHELYAMGVRLTYLAHESDSDFAGAAYHHWPTLMANNELKQIKETLSGSGQASLFAWLNPAVNAIASGQTPVLRNPVGLKSAGRSLVEEMMRLNMLIDIDHLSRRAVDDVYQIAVAHDYYPLLAGHTRVEELLAPGQTTDQTMELVADANIFGYIADTGGMIALRTGPDKMLTHPGTPGGNDCAGSVKSFNQFYQWVIDHGYKVAFGTDMNGYVPAIAPRWGTDACAAEPSPTMRSQQRGAQVPIANSPTSNPPGWSTYVDRGLVDIGALPSLVYDMQRLGVDTAPLRRSTEDFLVSWARAYDPNRARVPRPMVLTPSTIAVPIKPDPLPGL